MKKKRKIKKASRKIKRYSRKSSRKNKNSKVKKLIKLANKGTKKKEVKKGLLSKLFH